MDDSDKKDRKDKLRKPLPKAKKLLDKEWGKRGGMGMVNPNPNIITPNPNNPNAGD